MTTVPPDFGFPASVVGADSGSGGLIVCEREGAWATGLRRELAGAGIALSESRNLTDAWSALTAQPASMLVVEVTAQNIQSLLRRMAWLSRDFPRARIAVVANRRASRYEWLVREAGAVHFACSPRGIAVLAHLAIRHLAETPPPQQTLVERIWSSLPWR